MFGIKLYAVVPDMSASLFLCEVVVLRFKCSTHLCSIPVYSFLVCGVLFYFEGHLELRFFTLVPSSVLSYVT